MEEKPLILAVDDEPSSLMLISRALQEKYTLALAKSARLALQFLKRKTPSLILLDILMPEKDGLTLAKELRANKDTASLPFVFLSGTTDIDTRKKALALGACDFIEKPIAVAKLRETIDSIFNSTL